MSPEERQFVGTVWRYYRRQGRHDLPWRRTIDPYHILVSEVMLQQTQVERVIPKFVQFLKRFPTIEELARAPLGDVLMLWQGLGYNRRAKLLHDTAVAVVTEHGGQLPMTAAALRELPGIGPYTASALMAFAYNAPEVLIETNVRTVFIHHFFKDATGVPDANILALVERTLPKRRARQWYAALMDYGSYLKRAVGNQNVKSSTYKKQSRFAGSERQVRGAIVRTLVTEKSPLTLLGLAKKLPQFEAVKVIDQLATLTKEGLVVQTRGRYHLPN